MTIQTMNDEGQIVAAVERIPRPDDSSPLEVEPRAELERLLQLVHPDPHSILGAHPTPQGLVVRAFRPDATGIDLLIEGSAPRPMRRLHAAGLFGVLVDDCSSVPRYRLAVHYGDAKLFTLRDPYGFLPTLGDLDIHLVGEGRHELLYEKLGAHVREIDGVRGVSFAVWAPSAAGVSVVGDFNGWDGRLHPMRTLGAREIWELFVPDLEPGALYKFEIRPAQGPPFVKADPCAQRMEPPPGTASVVFESSYEFQDAAWMTARAERVSFREPLAIYEVHLGSWRRVPEEGNRVLTYRELAPLLADYVSAMGFTHVELLPIMEHPFGGSWGYQVSAYFAPTARHGGPDDLRFLIDHLHQRGIGVILDWVPAHFPRDAFALARFDGTALYEHLDPRQGEHPDWGTLIFNYGRNEVRNFLLANALFWLSEFHVDGLRLDAVASMLYLDYSRVAGQWIPNRFGGSENLEAIAFLKQLNELAHARQPGVMMIAEESTSWPKVSHPTWAGGLGFGFKWNMGWMHDTLSYFARDPIHRRYHHNQLTFGLLYAWSENFILPLSHDEVVHGKRSLLDKMPGDGMAKIANLRAMFAYMWSHPGKKLLFMGGEIGVWHEWNHDESLDWRLTGEPGHHGLQRLVQDLNRVYRDEPALWNDSEPSGFSWLDADDCDENVIAFMRLVPGGDRVLVCVCNFSATDRTGYRVGLPRPGVYREVLNTDSEIYGGTNRGNLGAIEAQAQPWQGQPCSAPITLPPLAAIWFSSR